VAPWPAAATGAEPRPVALPAHTAWHAAYFDVKIGADDAGRRRPFHLLAARFELLLAARTLVFLRGWPVDHALYVIDVATADAVTSFAVLAQAERAADDPPLVPDWPRGPVAAAAPQGTGGGLGGGVRRPPCARLHDDTERSDTSTVLFDRRHELLLTHRRFHHTPLDWLPMDGLHARYVCPSCGAWNPGVDRARPQGGCLRCDYTVHAALASGTSVLFELRLARR
jgi:hypothetical protein